LAVRVRFGDIHCRYIYSSANATMEDVLVRCFVSYYLL